MAKLQALFAKEAVAILGLFTAFVAMLSTFGLSMSPEQSGGITAFAALVFAFIGRSQVYSQDTMDKLGEIRKAEDAQAEAAKYPGIVPIHADEFA